MRLFKRIIFFLTVVVFPHSVALGQENPMAVGRKQVAVQRFCRQEDLENRKYKRVSFRQVPPRGENNLALAFPNDYIAFWPGKHYSDLLSNRRIKPKKLLDAFLAYNPKNFKSYTLDEGGVLNLLFHDRIAMTYRCVTAVKSIGKNYKAGDLILDGYTRKGKSIVYKVYRQID